MEQLKKINRIIVHHSQQQNDSPIFIRQRHLQRGWEDIGYHWLIGNKTPGITDGKLYEGRSERFAGAHAFGHNKDSLGICLIGNLDEVSPTQKQIDTLIKFLKEKMQQHRISVENVFGHRELPNVTKTCPGKFVDMEEIRNLVNKKI